MPDHCLLPVDIMLYQILLIEFDNFVAKWTMLRSVTSNKTIHELIIKLGNIQWVEKIILIQSDVLRNISL